MNIPETLQERVSALYKKSAEVSQKAMAYFLVSIPKLTMIGGGALLYSGVVDHQYGRIFGGAGLIVVGWMTDDTLSNAIYQARGPVIYEFNDESQPTIDHKLK